MASLTTEQIEIIQNLVTEEVAFLQFFIQQEADDPKGIDTSEEKAELAKLLELQSALTSLE